MHPIESLGNSLKMWYYFVLGFGVGAIIGATGVGFGITIFPGLMVAKGTIGGGVGVGCVKGNGILIVFLLFYLFFLLFLIFLLPGSL
jgi:hypothetical protein